MVFPDAVLLGAGLAVAANAVYVGGYADAPQSGHLRVPGTGAGPAQFGEGEGVAVAGPWVVEVGQCWAGFSYQAGPGYVSSAGGFLLLSAGRTGYVRWGCPGGLPGAEFLVVAL